MKLSRKKLRKIIQEAVYLPSSVSKEEVEFANMMRGIMSPEQKKKADALASVDINAGVALGGFPEDRPDLPMKNFAMGPQEDDPLGGYGRFTAGARDLKEVAMNIEDAMIDYVIANGFKVPESEDPDDFYYAVTEKSLYFHFMRKERVSRDVLDFIMEVAHELFVRHASGRIGKLICVTNY